MNPEAVSKLILGLPHTNIMTVYFDSEALLEQDAHTWTLLAIITGHTITLRETQKGTKKGHGSALLFRAEDIPTMYSVLPNNGNKRDAEFQITLEQINANDLFPPDLTQKIRNAISKNVTYRRGKPGKHTNI